MVNKESIKNTFLRGGFALALAAATLGVTKCIRWESKSNLTTENVKNIKTFAIKSVTDTFNIKMDKKDSVAFSNYIDELMKIPGFKAKVLDLGTLIKNKELLSTMPGKLNRNGLSTDIYAELFDYSNYYYAASRHTSNLDSIQLANNKDVMIKELSLKINTMLSKYKEYNSFLTNLKKAEQTHFGYTSNPFYLNKYTPTKEIKSKPKPVTKKMIPRARTNLRPR